MHRRLISITVFLVVAGLPVMKTVCDTVCAATPIVPVAAAATHEDETMPCHQTAPSASRLSDAPGRHCHSHDAATAAALIAARADDIAAQPVTAPEVRHEAAAPVRPSPSSCYSAATLTPSPPRPPIPLRI